MKIAFKTSPVTAFVLTTLVIGFAGVQKVKGHNYFLQQQRLSSPTTTPTPKITPKPSVSPTPKPTPVQTLENLQSKIRERLLATAVQRGRVGVKITSLKSGKVIFENDAEKYFIPASNMKNFTVAAALEKLGPDFRFVTSVYANAKPDATGTIKGDLRIFGRGDISISTAFNNGDYYKGIDNLVDKIIAAGVKRIEGDLVGDESYFDGFAIPLTWEWDDLQWYDGAEISALPVNNNAVDLSVKPGTKDGSPCIVTVLPQTLLMQVVNTCTTLSPGSIKPPPRRLKVFKSLGRNTLEVSGTLPIGDKGFTGYIAFTHPADMFIELLRQRLVLRGVALTGGTRTSAPRVGSPSQTNEIVRFESQPFREIVSKIMKPSQNMFTETVMWTLGEIENQRIQPFIGECIADCKRDSSVLGLASVQGFLESIGIPKETVLQYDGSGLSRHDQVTPSAVVALYTYMVKQSKNAQVWRDSLTVGGIDGTLSRRFAGTLAVGNVRGKTGTLDQVSALSGYLTTAGGEEIIISIIVNGVAEPKARTSLIDDIVVQLANFNGKIN